MGKGNKKRKSVSSSSSKASSVAEVNDDDDDQRIIPSQKNNNTTLKTTPATTAGSDVQKKVEDPADVSTDGGHGKASVTEAAEKTKQQQKRSNKKIKLQSEKRTKAAIASKDDDDDDDDNETESDDNNNSNNAETDTSPTIPADTKTQGESTEATETTAIATKGSNNNNNNNMSNVKENFYSDETFANMPLSDKMKAALTKLQFVRMTRIQAQSIPALLMGKDVIGAAPTGSGKTLAFVVPLLELLHQTSFSTRNGTGGIIITPTRELALQIYGVVSDLVTAAGPPTPTYGLIMGGANRKTEAEKLARGVSIIICTPGRLLDHLQNTKGFIVRNLLALVMDEADRILEQGFEDDLRSILRLLPKTRQTVLFSATQTQNVEDLVRLSIQPSNSVYVHVPSGTPLATAEGLEQGYVTCPSDQRFLLLFTFLKKNKKKKIMVFFSSCNSVKFHAELLNYIDVPVLDIHGRQKQVKRTTTFFQFCQSSTGTLLCTDVAARGLDIPRVDWIIQFDPPDDPKEYIHRVGRTARGATGSGRALLFLTPEEIGFLRYLKKAKVSLSEYEFPVHKVANVQSQLQRLLETNYYLNRAARDAYRSYLLSYASHAHRDIFNVHALDLQAVGKAFGFTSPPRVDIALGIPKKDGSKKGGRRSSYKPTDDDGDKRNKKRQHITASGRAFSADNPYGKRDAADKRQFTH